MSILPPMPEMEQAFLTRDASYDGLFVLGVRTTGIFCRPSCPARKPLVQHVEYFAAPGEAMAAGYRPCKRCDPLNTHGTPPDWVQGLLDELADDPTQRLTDADLLARNLQPASVRRYFLQQYGMTFHAYCRAQRMGEALTKIQQGIDLNDVTLGHGYESFSGFREAFGKMFGQPPGKSQSTDCIRVNTIETPLGPLLLGATNEGICLAEFSNRQTLDAQMDTLRRLFDCAIVPGITDHHAQAIHELAGYFAGARREFSVPLIAPGTPFQQTVWEALRQIPYGETRSYEELAEAIGKPTACRAVGATNGLNRIAIMIPCHRVVNKGGQLGGYGGGLWRKQALLDLERGREEF